MTFEIFTDSSSNITSDLVAEWDIRVVSLHVRLDHGEEMACYSKHFDGHGFYNKLRDGSHPKTSMINIGEFIEAFEPVLREGKDILYIGMSSGISGTVRAAEMAAEELLEKHPERKIRVVDTLAASFGEGLLVRKAALMRAKGESLEACTEWCEHHVQRMNQYLAVDDLGFLKAGGRISGITALVGVIARIKPVLWGNTEGKFSIADRSIGRKKSLRFMAKRYAEHADQNEMCAIAHADDEAAALDLVDMIREINPKAEILMRCYEPGTGAHTGPNAVALFFFGEAR